MARRRYSDEDRAFAIAALASNGGNVWRTSQHLGIPDTTLRQWANGLRHPEAVLMSEEKKSSLAERFDEFASRVLRLTTDEDIKAATLKDRFTAAGIAVDKARLLKGEPTEITEDRADDPAQRFRELYQQVGQERAALVADADGGPQPLPEGEAPDAPPARLPGPDLP